MNTSMAMTTEKVWEEFHPKLKQFVLRRIPDEQSSEDVLQDVFLKIHTRIDTLRDEEKLRGRPKGRATPSGGVAEERRRHADAAVLRLGPTAAEEVGAARETEALRASLRRLIRLDQVVALEDVDRRRSHPDVHRAAAAGELLAALAMAVAQRLGCLGDLELHTSAEAASTQGGH